MTSIKALAIVPARGGSKRIPRKNIKSFLGLPIMAYSIQAALRAKCFTRVMVSTDDKEIAELGAQHGAEVPFLRSPETSTDHAMTADVVREVLFKYRERGEEFEFVCCIYPTAPFISPEILQRGLSILTSSNADGAVPVVRFGFPIQRAFRIREGRAEMIWPENRSVRSQDLEPAFHDAGQFYWLRVARFLELNSLFMPNTTAIELPETEAQDIDNDTDWQLAELKYRLLRERCGQ